jgi:DNA repair exonuclease SbcCD nuclease subunit
MTDFLEIMVSKYYQVIVVPGNHDLSLNRNLKDAEDAFVESCESVRAIPLVNESVLVAERDNYAVIHGSTLWSPALSTVSDEKYRGLRIDNHRMTWRDARELYFQNLSWLKNSIQKYPQYPNVIVTHHAPLEDACDSKYRSDPNFSSYVSSAGLELISKETPVVAWAFGHTHFSYNQEHNKVYFHSNPLGFPREKTGFSERYFFEI